MLSIYFLKSLALTKVVQLKIFFVIFTQIQLGKPSLIQNLEML